MKTIAVALLFVAYLPGGTPTPAGKAIEMAQAAIEKEPAKADHHSALALAYARRARETADSAYYDKAAAAATRSLELSPDNMEAIKVKAWILLGKHEFADALKLAMELRKRTGDDEMVYALLADANAELGNYKEAEDAAQWMLNVGRSSIPGLMRAAYLREVFGDIEGALELMYQAFNRLIPSETEERSWTLTQIAHLLMLTGKIDNAGTVLEQALQLTPEYHYALAGLAKVQAARGKHDEAIGLLRRRYELAPHPENLFDLGSALRNAGKLAESNAVLADFERKALKESEGWDNANRELIAYYTDYATQPAAALRIARREIARRRDVMTVDAYAWALHRNGRSREALKEIQSALAVGTVDPRILYHAGAIAMATGNHEAGKKYLQQSLDVNSRSEVAAEARRLLVRFQVSAQAKRPA
jgi:tetratricopeptide (TPR) repeat protein